MGCIPRYLIRVQGLLNVLVKVLKVDIATVIIAIVLTR